MIQTAEGALNETHDILQRMRELATQAANDTNVGVDRGEIQKKSTNYLLKLTVSVTLLSSILKAF